tara:strand:- start:336 stop:485 length:150 start_codon:yes stop_codon:yes gene_type:complete
MNKDLTASLDNRKNILNNCSALQRAEQHIRVDFNFVPGNLYFSRAESHE